MTASVSRQVEDRRLLNETSGKGWSVAPARRTDLTFTWDSIHGEWRIPEWTSVREKKIVRVRGDNKVINRARFLRRAARSVLQCVYVDVVAIGCFAHAKLDTRSGILSRHAFRENRYPAVSLMRENGIVCKKKSWLRSRMSNTVVNGSYEAPGKII